MSTTDHNQLRSAVRPIGTAGFAALCATLALAGGCVAEFDPGDAPDTTGTEVIERDAEVLGEFETADGVRVTFTAEYESDAADARPVVAITTVGPDGAYPYLADLGGRAATSLEAFLALAPAGTEVPEIVRGAHEREAASLDRSAEVREFSLASPPTLATPYSSASCASHAAFQASLSLWTSPETSASTQNHSLTRQGTGGNILAAMCNYDSNRVDYKYGQFCYEVTIQGSEFGLLVCESKVVVPDGYRIDKAWLGATTKRLVRAEKLANYTLTVTSYIGIGGYVVP